MGKKIDVAARDEGEVNFNVDFATAKVQISMRPPLHINRQTVEIHILDFMEISANILLESIKLQREQLARLASAGTKKETQTA